VPVFAGARTLAERGVRTGASARNWRSVADMIDAPADWPEHERDLFCDPQTSGGLLVSCAPEAARDVLALFARHGHENVGAVGRVTGSDPRIRIA